MSLLSLPNELLYMIAKDSPLNALDLSCFCRTNRHLKTLLTPLLVCKGGKENVLLFASQRGFVSQARDALALGADVEAVDLVYRSPALHWAAGGGHKLVVKLLLQHGAKVARGGNRGRTALHCAATKDGADPNCQLALHCAATKGGAGFNCQPVPTRTSKMSLCCYRRRRSKTSNQQSDTVIHWPKFLGALHGIQGTEHEAVVSLLLDNLADINVKDIYKATPLCLAVQFGDDAITKLLLERGADISLGSVSWLRSLAAGSSEDVTFRLLMEWDSHNGTTTRIPDSELSNTFLVAASNGNEQAVKCLLVRGAAISTTDELTGDNALHMAVAKGHENIVIQLLGEGLDINMTDREGRTLLHRPMCPEMMALLLERGVDVDARDPSGQAPLHILARRRVVTEVIGCIDLILAKGADIGARDIYGRTPLHRAVICSTLEVVKLLLQNKACTASQDDGGLTALHWAAMAQRPDIVRLLVEAGADIAVRSHNCRTLLHEIIHLSTVEMKGYYKEENVWIAASGTTTGSYRSGSFHMGPNWLEHATWEEMVKLLLDLGANAFAVDNTGYPPYKAARAIHWRSLSDMITEHCPPKILPDDRLTSSFDIRKWHQSNSNT